MNLFNRFADWLIARAQRRAPDIVIGGHERPYLRRWWLIPRNPVLNFYLHQFLRSDDDRALHDHPWANCSVLLRGWYFEHTIEQGGVQKRQLLEAGAVRMRWSGKLAHRVELTDTHVGPSPCWTLFITGPRYRQWGFHCTDAGWIHWAQFTADDDRGAIGKGCDA
jgi:hypothetical protein